MALLLLGELVVYVFLLQVVVVDVNLGSRSVVIKRNVL